MTETERERETALKCPGTSLITGVVVIMIIIVNTLIMSFLCLPRVEEKYDGRGRGRFW